MPRRIIDGEAIWKSDKISAIEPPRFRGEFANLLPLATANGTFECNARAIWATCYGYNRPDMTPDDVPAMLDEFERVKLLFRWAVGGKTWGYWVGIDKPGRLPSEARQRERHEKTGPEVPQDQLRDFLGNQQETNREPIGSQQDANREPIGSLGLGVGSGSGSGLGFGNGNGSGVVSGSGSGEGSGEGLGNGGVTESEREKKLTSLTNIPTWEELNGSETVQGPKSVQSQRLSDKRKTEQQEQQQLRDALTKHFDKYGRQPSEKELGVICNKIHMPLDRARYLRLLADGNGTEEYAN